MAKETLDKKAKIVENFNGKVKHFIFPSRESLNYDCSSQVLWVEFSFIIVGFFVANSSKKEQIHIPGHEQREDMRAHHCKQLIMWEIFFVSEIKDSWTMENGFEWPLCDPLFLQSAIGFTASKDTEIKLCWSDSFLSLVYNISAGRKKHGAHFIFTLCSVSCSHF